MSENEKPQEKMILPLGDYRARLNNYGVREGKGDKLPMIILAFTVLDLEGAAISDAFFRGHLTEAALGQTAEALLVCGLKSMADITRVAEGPQGGVLNMKEEVSIKIEHDVNQESGKKYHFARFVNRAGGSMFSNLMSKSSFAPTLAGIPLAAKLAEIAKAKGYAFGDTAKAAESAKAAEQQKAAVDSKIPF